MRLQETFMGITVFLALLFGVIQWHEMDEEEAAPAAPNCPSEFYEEFRDFEACSKNSDCSLSARQQRRLLEERVACKNGPTFKGGDLMP